jgi:DNA-binding transcriptional MerR regulator
VRAAFGSSAEQITDLKFIRHAEALGFSLDEIQELLALRQTPHACSEAQSMLRRKIAIIREKTPGFRLNSEQRYAIAAVSNPAKAGHT